LRAEVAFYLGFGRGDDYGEKVWTTQQKNDLDFILRSGLRQFYFPPPVDKIVYRWSFLKPVAQLDLASGESTVNLPDDFGGIEGRVTVSGSSNSYWPITITSEGRIREMFARLPDTTGQPECAAQVAVKNTTLKDGQRWQLQVYPAADTDYTLNVAYYILPEILSGIRPFADGGEQHAETLLESCLAIAEQKMDDTLGVHSAKFRERLAASIAEDQKNKPANLGYNRDCSDGREWQWRRGYLDSQVTYNDTLYTE